MRACLGVTISQTVSTIAEDSLRQVLVATDIVDLIGQYVQLKKAGSNHLGLCPFHPERTPSFNVYQSNQSFYCFGCGKGGDAISFVRDHLGMPFVDAVRHLARRANITLVEEAMNPGEESAYRQRTKLIKIHNDAAKWMHQLLLKQGGEGAQAARDYLKKRGLTSDVAKRWLLGYAPDHMGLWREWSRSKGYDDAALIEAGLFIPRVEGQPEQGGYVRFRHRVMFPVRNDQGDVIAFSGRLLDPEAKGGKYINSPETPIFSKSQVFYGWDQTRRAITKADCAVICEGQIDLITAVEHGVENLVAPLGTAFTEHHARMLKRAASQVVLCFDADQAGYKAAKRCFQLMAPEGMFIRVASLPAGEDPDSLIRTQGADAFRARLAEAKDFFEFQIDLSPEALLPGKDLEKSRLSGALAENLMLLTDKIAQDTAINRCATRLNIPGSDLRLLVAREQKKVQRDQATKRETAERYAGKQSAEAPAEISTSTDSPPLVLENWALRHLLRLAMTDEETLLFLHEQASSGDRPWQGYPGGQILEILLAGNFTPGDQASLSNLLATLPAEQTSMVTRLLKDPPVKNDDVQAAQGAFFRLQYDNNRRRQSLIAQSLRAPNLTTAAVTEAMMELTRLKREEVDLQRKLPTLNCES